MSEISEALNIIKVYRRICKFQDLESIKQDQMSTCLQLGQYLQQLAPQIANSWHTPGRMQIRDAPHITPGYLVGQKQGI